ncbi:MAG: peptide-methionine (S)-S-oxide reductase MsrA [Pseudomonadota bacterium]
MRRLFPVVVATLAVPLPVAAEDLQTAVLAGGCFWCVESDFDKVPGVVETLSGYAGGTTENPTYKEVVREDTGHREVVQVTFDAEIVSRAEIYDLFLRSIDPLDAGGQFCDRGFSYSTAIFAADGADSAVAATEIAEAEAELGQEIVTEIVEGAVFWPAEEYHQDFYKKSALRYKP